MKKRIFTIIALSALALIALMLIYALTGNWRVKSDGVSIDIEEFEYKSESFELSKSELLGIEALIEEKTEGPSHEFNSTGEP